MVQLTVEQRVFLVRSYLRGNTLQQTRVLFMQRFPDRNPPNRSTILKNVRKYEEHGTSLNRNTGHSGRPRTGRSQENI